LTDTGERVLRAMVGGQALTLEQVALAVGRCKRKTGAALLGCRVGGLVRALPSAHPARYQITPAGEAALADMLSQAAGQP
jgi:hypothetical protein